MTEQEQINQTLQRQIDAQGARIDSLGVKIDAFIEESRASRERQDTEIREIRQEMKGMQKEFYSKMDTMDVKIDGIGKHVQNLTIAAMVGIGAAVIGIGAIAITVVYSVFSR